MKIIFVAVTFIGFALAANAQVEPNLLQNNVQNFKLQGLNNNTNLNSLLLTKPLANVDSYLALQPTAPLAPIFNFDKGQVVYSRMPVAHLNGTNKMPVVKPDGMHYTMLVKRFKVVNPLKPDVPFTVGP